MVGAALIMARFSCNARKRKQGDHDRREQIDTQDARVPRGEITSAFFEARPERLRMWPMTGGVPIMSDPFFGDEDNRLKAKST